MQEKHQQQLAEDRRIAENLQRQIMNEVGTLNRERERGALNIGFEIEITPANMIRSAALGINLPFLREAYNPIHMNGIKAEDFIAQFPEAAAAAVEAREQPGGGNEVSEGAVATITCVSTCTHPPWCSFAWNCTPS
jgi:hypothetical protein